MLSARLAAIVVSVGMNGCGTSILVSYPTDTPFLRAHSDVMSSEPIGPLMARSRLTLDSGPLRVSCRTEEYTQWARITRTETFDGQGRVVVLFMAVSELAMAAMFAGYSKDKTAGWITAAIAGADGTGALIYGIAESDQYTTSQRIGPGVPRTSDLCPPGTTISGGGRSVPVDQSGKPQGDVGGMISIVLQTGGTISVSAGGRVGTWNPDAMSRCELAREINHPQTSYFCPAAPPVPQPNGPSGQPPPRWKPGQVTIEIGGSVQGSLQGR